VDLSLIFIVFPAHKDIYLCHSSNHTLIDIGANQGPLYACLEAAIVLLSDESPAVLENPQCCDFLRETLEYCFLKLLCSKAVINWDDTIQHNVYERVIQVSLFQMLLAVW
jgi:hypothetical protein